jgi:hypothetical protein
VTTESIAAPFNDPKEHGSAGNKTSSFSLAALLATIFENLKLLLLLGPAIVGQTRVRLEPDRF